MSQVNSALRTWLSNVRAALATALRPHLAAEISVDPPDPTPGPTVQLRVHGLEPSATGIAVQIAVYCDAPDPMEQQALRMALEIALGRIETVDVAGAQTRVNLRGDVDGVLLLTVGGLPTAPTPG